MGLIDYIADVYRWWSWEIGQSAFFRGFSARPEPEVVLRVGRGGVRLDRPGAGGGGLDEFADPAEAGSRLKALVAGRRVERGLVEVVVEPGKHLERRLSRLRLPRSRMRAMARLDFQAATPFRSDDYVLILPEYREESPESSYFVVRRSDLAPLLESLRSAGFAVSRILCATEGDYRDEDRNGYLAVADRAGVAELCRQPAMHRLGRAVTRGAVASALVALLALLPAEHWRYSRALAEVRGEIATAERSAAEVRRSIAERERRSAEIAAVRRAKSQAVPLVLVIEELAGSLPDSTWLRELDFREGTVTFAGTSEAAAELIAVLDASPLFRAPTFSQPVLRDPGEGVERFTITLRTEWPDG